MIIEERSKNWCPLTTFAYAEDGKMTSATIDGNEVAITAWDAMGRPTAVAENDKGITLAYDDTASTLTITRGEQIWVFDGYCRCLKYEEDPTEVSIMTFEADVNHARAEIVGNDRYYYLITYENNTSLAKVDEYDNGGTDFIYDFKWTEKGLCAELKFTELDEVEGQTERVLQEAIRAVFTYDDAERVVKYAEYYEDYESGAPEVLEFEEFFTYNEAGLLVKEEGKSYDEDGGLSTYRVTQNEYNEKGQEIKRTRTVYDSENKMKEKMISVKEYKENGKDYIDNTTYYNADNVKTQELISEVTYQTENTGTTKQTTITYDENGVEVSREEQTMMWEEVK